MNPAGLMFLLIVLVVVALVIPARHDPAIRLKERNERHRHGASR